MKEAEVLGSEVIDQTGIDLGDDRPLLPSRDPPAERPSPGPLLDELAEEGVGVQFPSLAEIVEGGEASAEE
jgi:hypothetical protein